MATHSLINYAQWEIVSPESSLLSVGADGYIAQVWTGTARTPNVYDGVTRQRTFETAFLEYGALQNIARSSGKPIWYLNDPIEDNPNHSWTDYQRNWESTLVASLLQPAVSRYEVLPWPDRIFGPKAIYPSTEPTQTASSGEKSLIPKDYETELQTVFHALAEMDQPAAATHWEMAGTQSMGVLVSDTLMFQRAEPHPSDKNLGNFYGIALPLLMRGMPVEPVQIESAYGNGAQAGFLDRYRVLLLTYEGQKPPAPEFHYAIKAWVNAGGALIVVDNDKDPYNQAKDWWNTGGSRLSTPREHLFQVLGIDPRAQGLRPVGKGFVLFAAESPAALSYNETGSAEVMRLVREAAEAIRLPIVETSSLILRRGPYVIGAGLDQPAALDKRPTILRGNFVNLFDPNLAESNTFRIAPGTRAFLVDVNRFNAGAAKSHVPRILAASAKITGYRYARSKVEFEIQGIEGTNGVVRILCWKTPRKVTLNGNPLPIGQYEYSGRTLLLRLPISAIPRKASIQF